MSKNCLVTTLKGVINNDSLYYLGCITITAEQVATPDYSKRCVTFYGDRAHTGCVAKVVSGNIYFTDSTGTANYGNSKELNTLNPFDEFYVSNGDGIILVTNKYYIEGIAIPQGTTVKLNVGSLSGCNISRLNIRDGGYGEFAAQSAYSFLNIQGGVSGDLSDSDFDNCTYFNVSQCPNLKGTLNMSNNTVITTFFCKQTGITCNLGFVGNSTLTEFDVQYSPQIAGSVANLANGISTSINILGTAVQGTIEDYVEADWAKIRRSGTLTMSSGLTFNSVVIRTLHITYSNSEVVVRHTNESGNILGTYNGSTWTYNS